MSDGLKLKIITTLHEAGSLAGDKLEGRPEVYVRIKLTKGTSEVVVFADLEESEVGWVLMELRSLIARSR